jgi:hypothetical protein
MASNSINRQTWREQLASLLDAALDSTWDVFNYGTANFNGKARNVVVASGDSDYPELGADSNDVSVGDAEFDFYITVFILYADADQSWTAQNSEDALDLGRKKVADVIRDNYRANGYWDKLIPNGRSRVGLSEDEGGVPYRYEVIPVRAVKYS